MGDLTRKSAPAVFQHPEARTKEDRSLIGRSLPKDHERESPELTPCFRHDGEGCPRCDGSGYRPRRACDGCGEHDENLAPGRTARSWEEAKALPRYCPRCNPRRRNPGSVLAGLGKMGA